MKIGIAVIYLLVGLAVFMTGMNMMSSGIKKSAGAGLKNLFNKIKEKSIVNFTIGVGLTGIIQSSSATSVIAIGFINAGIMGLLQGVAVIMGANVGTTVTGILVSLSGFEVSKYLLLLAFIGVALQFFKKDRVQNIGKAIAGFGILFFGLSTMSDSIKNCPDLMKAFQDLFISIQFPLLLIIAGTLFAGLVQSFSATIGVVVVLINSGAITFSTSIYLLIGATIGSWLPIFLSSLNGDKQAKQASLVTFFVKVLAAIVGTAIIWPVEAFTGAFTSFAELFSNVGFAVAIFALLYNLILMLLILPFAKALINLSGKLIKDKSNENAHTLVYIDQRMLKAPAIAMMQVKQEIIHMFELAEKNFLIGYDEIKTQNLENGAELEEREENIDFINNETTSYLIKLSNFVNASDNKLIGSYFHIINDIERIGDHANNFHDTAKKMKEESLEFSNTAKEEFNEMYEVLVKMFEITRDVFVNKDFNPSELHKLEDKTDDLKLKLQDKHFQRITKKTCKVELSPFYSTFLSELERIADHLVNIGYAFINPTGDENEKQ